MIESHPSELPEMTTDAPEAIAVTVDDIRFVNYPNPDAFFQGPRPYRVLVGHPPVQVYSNVIYTPTERGGSNRRLGCLYDEDHNRIELACTRRRLTDDLFNTDPPRYTGPVDDLPVYEEPVYYLNHIRPHFGHFIEESVAHWWGVEEYAAGINRYLVHVYDPKFLQRHYVSESLRGLGISQEQIVHFDEPVRLKSVIVTGSAFQQQSHIYTAYRDTLRQIARTLGAEDVQPTDQPLYLSRTLVTKGVRQFVGEEHIESFLAERGARIVHPQNLPFAEQLQLINSHQTVIGFQGSQLSILVASLAPKTVVLLTPNRPWGSNIVKDRCYEHNSTYIRASAPTRQLASYVSVFIDRAFGKRVRFGGFSKVEQVDVPFLRNWFTESGLV